MESPTWILWGAVVLWTLGFDTLYAMPDREDDRRIGVNSSALFFGDRAPDAVAIFFAGTAIFLGWLGLAMQLHWTFWLSLGVAIGGWGRQSFQLHQEDIPCSLYGQIFRQNVGIGFILLAGMIAGTLL